MEQVGKGRTNLRRYVKILLRILTVFALIILLLWAVIYIYFRANKASLMAKVTKTVKEKLRGDVQIRDIGLNFLVNFPSVTLRLDDVTLRDSMYPVHHHELLKARKLFISSSTFQLLKGELHPSKITIEDGQIFIFTDGRGYSNKYITSPKQKDTTKSPYSSLPDKIVLKEVRVIYINVPKKKMDDVFVHKLELGISGSGILSFKTKIDAAIHSLAFNTTRGSFAKDKTLRGNWKMSFDTLQKLLTIKDAELKIGGHPFKVNASFYLDSTKKFRLQLATQRIPFRLAASLTSPNISTKLDSVDFAKPINITADIIGRTVFRDTPLVSIKWAVKDNILKTPKGDFQNCSFNASFGNQVSESVSRNDENSAIVITDLTADWQGIPLTSDRMEIMNLIHPVVTCDIQSNTDLSKLDEVIGSESFQFIKGDARTKIYYHGPVGDSATVSPYISGSFSFSNADMEYIPRGIKLTNFTGDIIFDSSDIRLKNLKGKVQQSPIEINAEVKNFFSLMNIDPGKLELTSSIYMPELDVQEFKSLLGQRAKTSTRKSKGKARLAKLSNSIDRFMDQCNMNTTLKADKVTYKKFAATDVRGNVILTTNTWKFKNVSLNHADGSLNLDGALQSVQGNTSLLNLDAKLANINISKLFNSFNNFGLDDISSKNIKGVLNTTIHLTGIMDNNATLVPSSMNGTIDLSLKKGELIDFEPLQKMSVFLLKKRDFSNLEFAELKNRFQLQGQSILINSMEVQSTALSMYVEGLYDMKGDSTDLVIQVPLSNLKKRKPDYVPENKGLDAKRGVSLYVRAKSGKGDDIDFSFGLFKKKSVLEKRKLVKEQGKP